MKKTVDVEISGIDFVLNSDAYELLDRYLEEMEEIFSSLPERKEILKDIESRIAEELLKRADKTKVINAERVMEILEKIGSPEEIYEVLEGFEYDKKVNVKARLYRDPDNAILGGVCSGIAAYLNLDPVIVRIFFIVFTLVWGAGFLVYILLWIIVPKAETPLQKMEMHGGGNALRKIDKGLRDIAKRFRISEMTRKFEETINNSLDPNQPKKKKVVKKEVVVKKTVKKKPVKKVLRDDNLSNS